MSALTRDRNIEHWDAEDVDAWEAGGKKVATRNLIWSIVAEHVGFSIWSIWSVMVLFMPQNVYHIDAAGKFFLVAMPTLVGAFLRIPYTVAPAKFGGRNWTIVSALLLLIPTVVTWYVMLHPGTSYTTFMIVAGLAGLGGGNFASSMTNINAFYPQRLKGWALGLNAGGGNIGVPVIQLVGLLVISTVSNTSPEIVCAVYLVAIACAAVGAAVFMDNLRNQKSNLSSLAEALRYKHSWVMSFLYIGTFGSFIGFSFAFAQVLQINYLAGGDTAAQASLHAAQISFLGPLLGSICRPVGGKLADRIGGGRITLYTFIAMIFAAGILVATGTMDDAMKGPPTGGQLTGYVVWIHPPVHPVGHRQRLDVQDDPVDLRGQGPGQGRPHQRGEGRVVAPDVGGAHRFRGRHRRARRRLHQHCAPGVLRGCRQVRDQCVLGVPRLLRGLRDRHVVRLPAPSVGQGGHR